MKAIIALILLTSLPAIAGESYPNVSIISVESGWEKRSYLQKGKKIEVWIFTDDEKLMQVSDQNGDGRIDYLRIQKPRDSYRHYVWTDTDFDGFFDSSTSGKLNTTIKVPTLSESEPQK